jgi:hypothetical protein
MKDFWAPLGGIAILVAFLAVMYFLSSIGYAIQ